MYRYIFQKRILLFLGCILNTLANPLYATSNSDSFTLQEQFLESITEGLSARLNPPCDINYLYSNESCNVLGPKNTQVFQFEAWQGYATHRYYFFYANAGIANFNLGNIDANSAYCALTLYKESPPDDPIAEVEGGTTTLHLQADLPECAWYILIVTTYGCGDYDDPSIYCGISFQSPSYDLRIKEAGFGIPYYDAAPGDDFAFPFVAQDIGIHYVPTRMNFFSSCVLESEYAYPVTVAIYAGVGLTPENLENAEYICYKEFYFGSYSEVSELCDDYFHIAFNDCSKLFDVYAVIDPDNEFNEGTAGEQNNIRHIMQVGVDHHIHGNVMAYDWNSMNQSATIGINGLPIDLNLTPGPSLYYSTITANENGNGAPGYFEFFVPYSYGVEQFYLKAWLDIEGVAEGYDLWNNLCFLKSMDFTEEQYFSISILLKPYGYDQDIGIDSMFNITANGVLGIHNVNEFMTAQLGSAYSLPKIYFEIINDGPCSFSSSEGDYTIKLVSLWVSRDYYNRGVIHELGHAVHQKAIHPLNNQSLPSCGMHLPGVFLEGEACAFVEGWASFFASIVPYQDPFAYTGGCLKTDFSCLTSANIELNANWLEFFVMGEGQDEEAAAAGILYDMYDNIDHFMLDQDDSLSEPFSKIYETLQWTGDDYSIRWFLDRYMGHELVSYQDPDWRAKRHKLCNIATANLIDDAYFVGKCDVYVCGDANGDNTVNLGDAVFLLDAIFRGGPFPNPVDAGDANCDGSINTGDPVYIVNYIFRGGSEPCCP